MVQIWSDDWNKVVNYDVLPCILLEYLQQINSVVVYLLVLENPPQKLIIIFYRIQGCHHILRGVAVFFPKYWNFSHFAFLFRRVKIFRKMLRPIKNTQFLVRKNLRNSLPLNLLSFSAFSLFSPWIVRKHRRKNGRKYLVLKLLFGRLHFEILSAR